jgi:hypothetical protein
MINHRNLDPLEQILEICLRRHENRSGNTTAKNQKIQILIDAQTKYEEQFGKIVDRSARRQALFARYNDHLEKSDERYKNPEEDWFEEILTKIQEELQD